MSETISYQLPEHLAARQKAMRKESTVQIIAITITILSFILAGLLIRPINDIRKKHQLVIDPDTIQGLPPGIALMGKLGTFRALAIDWAAIRAERLKEEGRTYEALQLHETVCALAPRFPKVWAYAAWNMAYNISVSQYTPEARWKWVSNGIKILRDKGIQYNPRSVSLYKELAWIYWNKIGGFMDDEHLNYKRVLAVEMERILGPPPIVLNDQEYYDWFHKMVAAPRDLDQLIRDEGPVAMLVERLAEVDLNTDETLLDFVARHIRPELQMEDLVDPNTKSTADSLLQRRLEIFTDEQVAQTLERLLSTIRSKILREEHRFDLDFMYKLMVEQYGPLDWRNAFSHSLYWSTMGNEKAKGYANINEADQMNTARFVFFSLQQLIMRGQMTFYPDFDDPYSSYLELTPDTRLIPYLYDTYLRLGKEQFGEDPRFVEGTPGKKFLNGMVTNMHNWIELLYLEGGEQNVQLATQYYSWLREKNPHPDGSTQDIYLITLDEFVMADIINQLQTYRAVSAIIRSFVRRSLKQFSLNQKQAAVTSMIKARQCYDIWMIDTKNDINTRRHMETPEIILRDEIYAFMKEPRVMPLFKARLWKHLPIRQQLMTFDDLQPLLQRICETQEPRWSIQAAFSEPPGMEQFRLQVQEYIQKGRLKDVDQGKRYIP